MNDTDAKIHDNTVTGNYASFDGGGLRLWSSEATIENNTIAGNRADDLGGGLYLEGSSPTIVNNTIADGSAHSGGGLYVDHSSPAVVKNTITGNKANDGAGISVDQSAGTITGNTITRNGADACGGGLYLSSYWYFSPLSVTNNTIVGNSAEHDGGGMYLYYAAAMVVANTITSNRAGGLGGGMHLYYGTSSYRWATIADTIVAFNSSGIHRDGGTPTLRYNCVYDNTEYDYSGLTDPTGADGNISADPLFVRNAEDSGDGWGDDPATPDVDEGANDDFGDLQLLLGSPCIDAGDNAAVPADQSDLDGDRNTTEPLPFDLSGWSRFVDDPLTTDTGSGTPPIVDIGAYEHRVELPGDCDPNGRIDLTDYTALADCLAGPGTGVAAECRCAYADLDGDVDLRDFAGFQCAFAGR